MPSRFFSIGACCLAVGLTWSQASRAQIPTWSPSPGERASGSVPQRDTTARSERRLRELRERWMLAVEGVTRAPVDMGVQVGLETPQGLRLSGGYGVVPGSYMNLLTGIAASASGNSYASAFLEKAEYSGRTWRVQAGIRPFRSLGLYGDFGYARLDAKGALDLASSDIAALAALGGGYEARTRLDMWQLELGYQALLAQRMVLAAGLGCMGTFNSRTNITARGGAPTDDAILERAATQADAALEKYGVVPTLSLRLGVDLI
jgi:hypothetical protein